MPIPCYLAMTGAEFTGAEQLPENIAWMACHYSCYGTGLSNLPAELPEHSLIIINDRTPPCGHSATQIVEQLQQLCDTLNPFGFLLDFQRPDFPENQAVTEAAIASLPCPVAVSELYARGLDCPVFLSSPPVDVPLDSHLAPWSGRSIWLEIALQTDIFTITEQGFVMTAGTDDPLPEPVFTYPMLCCKYHWTLQDDHLICKLQRSKTELDTLLQNAKGVDLAIGLYQQLGAF